MNVSRISRRQFLSRSGGALTAAWLATNPGAVAAAAEQARAVAMGKTAESYVTFSAAEARLFDTISARVVPSDTLGPGAREARVVVFADRILAGPLAELRPVVERGLTDFGAAVQAKHGAEFESLAPATQDAVLAAQEDSEFFQHVLVLVKYGLCSHPSRGGNVDEVGWRLLGFEDTHAFAPPFGHYDSNYPGYAAVSRQHRNPGEDKEAP